MLLLDTIVVSELRRPHRADRHVLNWANRATGLPIYLSTVTIFELEYGARLLERRDRSQGEALLNWIEKEIIGRYADAILPIDTAIARLAAGLHVPDPKPERDSFIAATALVHDLTVVTRNTHDFARTGVRLLNPWLPTG